MKLNNISELCNCAIIPLSLYLDTLSRSRRDSLSEILRVLRRLPHRLLRLPAVLHRQAELGLHLVLQHAALQRPQEEAARPLGGGGDDAADHELAPASAFLLPAAADASPVDVDATSSLYRLFSVIRSMVRLGFPGIVRKQG